MLIPGITREAGFLAPRSAPIRFACSGPGGGLGCSVAGRQHPSLPFQSPVGHPGDGCFLGVVLGVALLALSRV